MFLLAAFLFAPIFFLLLARLFFVTRVLETIVNLPIIFNFTYIYNIRTRFLSVFGLFVKIFVVLFARYHGVEASSYSTITLSRGQVSEITAIGMTSYTIGNKEIVSVKQDSKKEKLFIKANSQGFTEIKIWGRNERTIKIYVLTKIKQLKLLELQIEINNLRGIKAKVHAGKLWLSGTISTKQQYKVLHLFIKGSIDRIISNLIISKKLSRSIIGEVYLEFFDNFYDQVKCKSHNYQIECLTNQRIYNDKEFIRDISKKHNVIIRVSSALEDSNNYEIDIKLIQIEMKDGREVQFGLDNINLSLASILDGGIDRLKEVAALRLNQSNIEISTLARPKALISLGETVEIKVGSEIPYKLMAQTEGLSEIKWKFAGLKIKIKVVKKKNRFLIKYNTELTRPVIGSANSTLISGNKQSSSFNISLNVPLQAFEIGLKTTDNVKRSIPILNQIPILKELFASSSNFSTHKKIIAIFRLIKK